MNIYHFLTTGIVLTLPALTVEMTVEEQYWEDEYLLNFSVPITAPSNVGKAVEKSAISISPAISYEATWFSPTQIKLKLNESTAFRAKHTLRVKTLLGTAEAQLHDRNTCIYANVIGEHQRYAPVHIILENSGSLGNTIFKEKDCRDLLQKAYYEISYPHDVKREKEKIPALLRPLNVGEILELGEDPDTLKYFLGIIDEEWADFIALPKDAEVPNVWKAAACLPDGKDAALAEIKLILPEASYYDAEKKAYGDITCYVAKKSEESDYDLNLRPLSEGGFLAEIVFHQPVEAVEDWETLLSKITWERRYENDSNSRFENMGGGHYISKVDKEETDALKEVLESPRGFRSTNVHGDIELIFDKERSLASCIDMMLSGGETKRFVRKLVFRVKGGDHEATLVANVDWQSAFGTQLLPVEKAHWAVFYPIYPQLSMDVELGVIPSTGKREFRIDHDRHDAARLRVHRYKNSGAEAVRILAGYINYYQPDTYNRILGYQSGKKLRESPSIMEHQRAYEDRMLFPSDIAISEESRTLPLEKKGEQVFSLNDERLFPEGGSGLYLVELLADEMDSNAPYYSDEDGIGMAVIQGMVQLSDLGLFWKTGGTEDSLFVYGHRLSSAEMLQKPRLSLYDAAAKLLYEQEISPKGSLIDLGTALGKRVKDIQYIQISDGEDSCTQPFYTPKSDRYYSENALPPYPRLLSSVIRDRPIYRPGEKAYVKGYLRQLDDNELSIPSRDFVEAIEVKLMNSDVHIKTFEVALEEDGSFSYDVDIPSNNVGRYDLVMRVINKADEKFQSPDMLALGVTENFSRDLENAEEISKAIRDNRTFRHSLPVEEYRRHEFEIEGEYKLSDDENQVQVKIQAQRLSGAPLAGAQVRILLDALGCNFYPTGLRDYRFGDHRRGDGGYLFSYFYGMDSIVCETDSEFNQQLDASGQLNVNIKRPRNKFPLQEQLTLTSIVTSANQQSLVNESETFLIHPADYYVGIKQPERFSAASSQPMKLEFQAVDTEGKPCAVPSDLTLSITHRSASPYRKDGIMYLMHPTSSDDESTQSYKIVLDATGKGSFDMPREKVGIYTITLSGIDGEGRAFRSAIQHRVWGKGEKQQSNSSRSLLMKQDKDIYQAGDKVRLLLDSPVEGDVILTVEREGVMRHVHHSISAENPIIELELLPEDAPTVRVKATMIEPGDRSDTGAPRLIEAEVKIYIEPAEKALQVKLDLPKEAIAPQESCEIGGQVLDYQGKPLAGASLLLYVVDEGALQVLGNYEMPTLLRDFHEWRPHSMNYYESYPWLLPNLLNQRRMNSFAYYAVGAAFGGKMVGSLRAVSGGGGLSDWGVDGGTRYQVPLRENFNPCPLWLANIKTDAEGRFTAEVTNPDALTRYRVIAVASHGADSFGAGYGFYDVNKPIMLEVATPLSACKGDTLEIPITVSMKPADIPKEWQRDGAISWKLQLTGNDVVHIKEPVQTITLRGDAPVTTSFTVSMKELGEARFEWRIVPDVDGASDLSRYQDAIAESFTVRPATPLLREAHMTVLPPSSQSSVMKWVRSDFDAQQTRIDLSLSPSPLSAFIQTASMPDSYIFHGAEQLSTRCLPLIYAELFHDATGIPQMDQEKRQTLLASLLFELKERRNYSDKFYGFSDEEYGDISSVFSSYTALVLNRVVKSNLAQETDLQFLKYEFVTVSSFLQGMQQEDPDRLYDEKFDNVLWLYLLCSEEQLNVEEFQRILRQYAKKWTSVQDRWLIALSAQLLDAKLAEQMIEEAKLAESKFSDENIYYLPDTETIKLLLRVHQDASSLQTAELVNNYVRERSCSPYLSSYKYGWMCILLADYIEKAKLQDQRALVNGQILTASNPLLIENSKLSDVPTLQVAAQSDPVYASYLYEGFLKEEQPAQTVDKGFLVQRYYEKMQADGTWKPSSEFSLGDTVRVTITAKPRESSHYVIIEDYLPAGMEAVNPTTQWHLYGSMQDDSSFYSFSSWITNCQFMKDKVRFYITQWQGTELMQARYMARVTKAGVMKAPAAKAEEMYRPQVYGLALPMVFTVKD